MENIPYLLVAETRIMGYRQVSDIRSTIVGI